MEGPKGKDFGITNSTGFALFNLSKVGYGTLIVKAESSSYLPAETIITTVSPPLTNENINHDAQNLKHDDNYSNHYDYPVSPPNQLRTLQKVGN
ncbi:hypothetical protein [Thermococcus sp. JCM 11816]|uniref:hypothetical protein n=1 Tax=Thermococcus sp. (strain JCM 11816 / KS-1) TaxID=1295125 RepID=UPI0006CFA899